VFNSGQMAAIIAAAEQACAAGEPLNIVGHSMGGNTAIEVALFLFGPGLLVNNLITIDPVGPLHTVLPTQIPTTNFVQRQGLPYGSYLSGGNVTNVPVGGPDVNHFTITGNQMVQSSVQGMILGTRKSCGTR
jgi:pimeloyl-ACP methyl ester carboxylesterase